MAFVRVHRWRNPIFLTTAGDAKLKMVGEFSANDGTPEAKDIELTLK